MPERNVHPVPVERRHADSRRGGKYGHWRGGKNAKAMRKKRGKGKAQ